METLHFYSIAEFENFKTENNIDELEIPKSFLDAFPCKVKHIRSFSIDNFSDYIPCIRICVIRDENNIITKCVFRNYFPLSIINGKKCIIESNYKGGTYYLREFPTLSVPDTFKSKTVKPLPFKKADIIVLTEWVNYLNEYEKEVLDYKQFVGNRKTEYLNKIKEYNPVLFSDYNGGYIRKDNFELTFQFKADGTVIERITLIKENTFENFKKLTD